MNCPFCSKKVNDTASICPHCEAILDDSILGAMPEDDDNEDTPIPEPAPRRQLRAPIDAPPAASPSRRPAPRPAAPARPAAAAPRAASRTVTEPDAPPAKPAYTNKYAEYWTEDEPARPAAGAAPVAVAPPATASSNDPLEQVKVMWDAFLALNFEDKVTCSSGLGLVVMSLMPWRSTPDGEDLGFLTWGFLTLLLGLLSIGTIWARKTGRIAVPANLLPWAATAAGGLSALIAALFSIFSFERSVQYGKSVVTSYPSFGAYLSLLAAAGLVLGGVLTARSSR